MPPSKPANASGSGFPFTSSRVIAPAAFRPAVVFGPGNRANMFKLIRQIDSRLFLQVGDGSNMKSMAFALRFKHPERTMTEPEVQAIQERMVTAVATECGGRLREK